MRKDSGQTLVATMVVLVIICILAAVYFVGSGSSTQAGRPDGKGNTTIGRVIYSAKDDVCRSNLNQLRSGLQIAATNDEDKFPATLDETRLGSDFYKCPVGGEPYDYNPQTGKVKCIHPGHGKY